MELGLGTAQFGFPYGISNRNGQCSLEGVQAILSLAMKHGIKLIDTAASYGDSEAVIGQCLAAADRVKIVTKTPSFVGIDSRNDAAALLEKTFKNSLERLCRSQIYGLLLHNCQDALGENGECLITAMVGLKEAGLVDRIGISVYDAAQIDQVMDKFQIDIIQVPFNVFDQRLERSGHLQSLKDSNIVIQARSVFLQGLVLMEPREIPAYFNLARPLLSQFHRDVAEAGLTAVSAALHFVRQNQYVDQVVVGVTSVDELAQIMNPWFDQDSYNIDYSAYAISDEQILNPALWPSGDVH
jgi:aryl-alcohol dehydrogenase-like predicted oxidoreductase